MIGQMMEPVEFRCPKARIARKTWAATGYDGSKPRAVINSLYIEAEEMQTVNSRLQAVYKKITDNETRWDTFMMDDADICIVAYGTVSRVARNAITKAREMGIKAGLIRPVTLWPFPSRAIAEAAEKCKAFLAVEMSAGQMVEDVRLALNGRNRVEFHGRMGGNVPTQKDILDIVRQMADKQ